MHRSMHRWVMATTVMFTLFSACDDPVTVDELSGSYEASTFTLTQDGSTDDLLAQGASITMTLTANGSTSGSMFVPEGNEDGSDFEADLAGTWTLNGSQVSFDHPADTFLRDMSFTVDGGRLAGEATFDSATLRVVLQRS